MLNSIKLTASQIENLQYLYNNPGQKTIDAIKSHCNNFNLADFHALCSASLIKRTSPWSGDRYEITPEGRGIFESLKKQEENESYQHDYNTQTLQTAKKSNTLAIVSIIVSVLSFVVSIIALFVK